MVRGAHAVRAANTHHTRTRSLFQVRDVDADTSWGEAIDRNGYTGGTFKLPVVVHGDQAWWDIKDHAALAQELQARLKA